MRIKKGDTVLVIAGKDKGKKGKVLTAIPKESLIVVEGVNKLKKHQRATRGGQKGQIVEKTMPIHVSNAMVIDQSSGKPTRVGRKVVGGKMVRISKKSGNELSN
jgi:large subunit ribosomal protein L24